uniref:Immunoglobulin V-set domain-containing protein n=1 Tax=Sinocyclocheilus rhinocerous TaxID=307959 RepID=A0A673IQJ1_9TELE
MYLRVYIHIIYIIYWFSAEISVFVQTGASVKLDIQTQQLPEFDLFYWMNDKSEEIVRYINGTKKVRRHTFFENRLDFNAKTFSLTLKNMQKTDSGLYRARASADSDINIVTYRVSVIDAVKTPVLIVNSNRSSPDSCSFTCNGSNSIISSIYNSSSCSREEVTSSDNHILRLSCMSWKTDTKTVNELCTVNQASLHLLWLIPICLFTSGLLVLVSKKKKCISS